MKLQIWTWGLCLPSYRTSSELRFARAGEQGIATAWAKEQSGPYGWDSTRLHKSGEKKKKKNFPWIAGVTEKTKQNMQGSWKPNTYMCASSSFYFSCWLISRELNIDSWWVFHKFNSLNRRGALQCPALTIFSPQWTQILRIPPGDDCSDKLVHNRDFYYAHLQSRIFPQPCKSTRVAFHDTGFKIILV